MKNFAFQYSGTFILMLAVICGNYALGQTGAAGVGNNISNIVWLDANSLGLANGATVSSFTDLSGNGNHFTQGTGAKRPVYNTGVVNSLPAIHFDGVDDALATGSISSMVSANVTYFIVFQRTPNVQQFLLGANYAGEIKKWQTYCNNGSNSLVSAQYSPAINHVSYVDPGAFTFTSTHITPSNMFLYKQGTLQMTKVAAYTLPTAHNNLTLGNVQYPAASNCTLNGYIAEVIIYNKALNNLQRKLIENYLGAKYNMAISTDLYAFESTHNIGLIGLGNDGINTQGSARGAGILELSGATDLTGGEYFIVAHTSDPLANLTTSDLPASISTHSRFTRTWRLDETGSTGNTTLTFYLSGGYNFGTSSSYRLLVDNDGVFSDASVISGTYNSTNQTITFITDISDGQYFTLAGLEQPLDIYSIASGSWSNPNVWDCTCVPTLNDNVFINPFHNIEVDINAETKNLSVEPNGTLTMSSNVTLGIYGNWDVVGNTSLTAGKIAMKGVLDQYIDCGGGSIDFYDLEINNTGGAPVTIYEGTHTLTGTLYPVLGSLILDPAPGNTFTFLSTANNQTARIDEVPGGFTFSGTYTVQRYIDPGSADYRNLCSPVTGAKLSEWDTDIYISGTGFPDGCATDGSGCFYSCRYYTNGISYNVTSITHTMVNGKGYEIFLGDDLNVFSGVTLKNTGTLENSSGVAMSLNTGWHTIGNPFVSPVLYSQTTRTSQISNYFYVYDAALGDYQYYDGVSGLGSIPDLDNGLMSVGQGIWIYVTSLGSITFEQSDKSASNAMFIRSEELSNEFKLTLSENSSTYRSSILLSQDFNATDGMDSIADMRQLYSGFEAGPRAAFDIENNLLKKNVIASDNINKAFDIHTIIKNSGYYTINVENVEIFADYKFISLFDKQTNEIINLKTNPDYTFFSNEFDGVRFTLLLSNAELTTTQLTAGEVEQEEEEISINQLGNIIEIYAPQQLDGVNVSIQLTNLLGQETSYSVNTEIESGQNLLTLPADMRGIYLFTLRSNEFVITKKMLF
jgi:hypothetical protein